MIRVTASTWTRCGQLELAGDHAVDIAEQVWFLVTGELREFTSSADVRAW